MGKNQSKPGALFVGLYAWIVTIFIGAILMNLAYAKLVPYATTAFSEVSDFLLIIGLVTFLTGLVAIAISWKSKVVRTLFIASLLVLSFEFVMSIFASQLIDNTQIFNLGRWFRFIPVGLASILAFFGMYRYFFYLE